jgi:hypothetical protein
MNGTKKKKNTINLSKSNKNNMLVEEKVKADLETIVFDENFEDKRRERLLSGFKKTHLESLKGGEDKTAALRSTKLLQQLSWDEGIACGALYSYDDINNQRIGTLINAIYSHNSTVFMISYRLFNRLERNDRNIDSEGCSGTSYRIMMRRLFDSNMITCLRPPHSKKAGLYKLIYLPFTDPLIKRIGRQVVEVIDQNVVDFFDSEVVDKVEADNEEEPLTHTKTLINDDPLSLAMKANYYARMKKEG